MLNKEAINNFTSNQPPAKRKSVFINYLDDIKFLLTKDYSIKQIYQYLVNQYKITKNISTLYKFISKHKLDISNQPIQENINQEPSRSKNKSEKEQKDTNTSTQTKNTNTSKNKIVQLKQKKDPNYCFPPPPKTISDEEFLTLCDHDKVIYCYKLFNAGYEEEGDRLLRLPGVDSVLRTMYRARKRGMYERTYFRERKDLDMDN